MFLPDNDTDNFLELLGSDDSKFQGMLDYIKYFPSNSFNKKFLEIKSDNNKPQSYENLLVILKNSSQYMSNNFRIRFD